MVLETKIDDFLCEMRMGVDFFFSAGKKLVVMLDEDPHIFEDIVKRSKDSWVTLDVLKGFEMIGRKQLAVQAMFLPKHVLNRMIGMPLEEQEKMLEKPVEVAAGKREGHHSYVLKPAAKLTRNEAKRVIAPTGARTVDEQVALMAAVPPKSLGKFCLFLTGGGTLTIKPSVSAGPHVKIKLTNFGTALIELIKL